MPVILTTREEIDLWMNAPAADALKLQRQLLVVFAARLDAKSQHSGWQRILRPRSGAVSR